MIEEILKYQAKEKEKIALEASIEGGKVKQELTLANKNIENAKRAFVALDNDAKSLEEQSKKLEKIYKEVAGELETVMKNEDVELGKAQSLLANLNAVERQLAGIMSDIEKKSAEFENMKLTVAKAQKAISVLTPEYEKQVGGIASQIAAIDAELNEIAKTVDATLLAKYKQIRKNRATETKDIVVPLIDNRCAGCFFELALATVHKVQTAGVWACENCGRIIYIKDTK
jgi:predicted  nucleic acid-binding Zn-ribbon protein